MHEGVASLMSRSNRTVPSVSLLLPFYKNFSRSLHPLPPRLPTATRHPSQVRPRSLDLRRRDPQQKPYCRTKETVLAVYSSVDLESGEILPTVVAADCFALNSQRSTSSSQHSYPKTRLIIRSSFKLILIQAGP